MYTQGFQGSKCLQLRLMRYQVCVEHCSWIKHETADRNTSMTQDFPVALFEEGKQPNALF